VMEIGLPILFAIFLWWFSTGAILYLDGLNRRTFGVSMAAATCVAVAALVVLVWTRNTADPFSAYAAFTAALVIWGWNEMAFLMGFITGPRRIPSRGRLSGWPRFREAAETIISHEIAIVLSLLVIAILTWGGANMVGLWTFVVLWLMRLSTKFNIFLGAPNVTDEFLPAHLTYLSSYFRRRPMNGLFPLSITVATLITAWLAQKALGGQGSAFEDTGYSLLASLMALAVLEHWLMFIPLPTSWLWRWSLKDRLPDASVPATVQTQDTPPRRLSGSR
jgi:putative photosynthetic complex assembly protein 2